MRRRGRAVTRGRGSERGTVLLEALAAGLLAAVAAAGLASAATLAGVHVRLQRERAAALALAAARLEALRAGPRDDGADTPTVGGVAFARSWTHDDGRGLPDTLGVQVGWGTRAVALATRVWP